VTTYVEVAQALVSAGYLSDADVESGGSDYFSDQLYLW